MAVNQGIKIPKAIPNSLANGSKIKIRFKHKTDEIIPGYLLGRENPTPVPSTVDYGTSAFYYTSGGLAYSFYWMGSTSGACIIPVTSLQNNNLYLATLNIDAILSFKMNKITRVNNSLVYGPDINSTTTAKGVTTPDMDLGVLCGNYISAMGAGSKHQVIDIEFINAAGECICYIPFSEGAGNKITDVCNNVQYTLNNISDVDLPTFWQPKQDIIFYNFYYGFTLYQKTGEADIRIPNLKDGSEITPASVPSGYARIANYKESRLTFNNSENVFVLDNVSAATVRKLFITGSNIADMNGWYDVAGQNEGQDYYDNATGYRVVYSAGYWYFTPVVFAPVYRTSTSQLDSEIIDIGGGLPVPVATFEDFTTPSPLYAADVDHFLFTENTGIAKEFDIKLLKIDFGIDRGYLYIKETTFINFMLYASNKTLLNDVEILNFFGLGSRIQRIDGEIQYIDGRAVYI